MFTLQTSDELYAYTSDWPGASGAAATTTLASTGTSWGARS